MTTPDDRPYSERDEDRRMTDADRDALDRDHTSALGDRERPDLRGSDHSDLADAARTTDLAEGDRTTGYGEGDRTTGYGEGDRTTGYGERERMSQGDPDPGEPGTEWSAGPTTAATTGTTTDRTDAAGEPVLADELIVDFRTRWEVIQQGFVDDPRRAVSEADKLVDDVLKRLSESFDRQHQALESQWSDGEPSTEDLRSALQKYRAFFQRLLAM
jgi:hypothetical protein